jgi:hypothetical protein
VTKKTWIWIIVSVAAACVIGLVALAGAGIYFATRHVKTSAVSAEDARAEFDRARAVFKDQTPLIELDEYERPRSARPTSSMPNGTVKPTQLWILVWDPGDSRTVRISLPFWLLRIGRQKLDLGRGDRQLDFDRLSIDVNELERIGPALVMDFRSPHGERVLLWTQ